MYILSLQCKKIAAFSRTLGITLISTAILYAVTGLAPAYSQYAYDFLGEEKSCLADVYVAQSGKGLPHDVINCTANDIEITEVVPRDAEAECTLGEPFTFLADVTIKTNASERWDGTFYLPLTEQSPQFVQVELVEPTTLVFPDYCSMILPDPLSFGGILADRDLDGDGCGDIAKGRVGPVTFDSYTLSGDDTLGEPITMLCADVNEDGRADFTYCAAWQNKTGDNCTAAEDPYSGQWPTNKAKCGCNTFDIAVFIRPDPPPLSKTLISGSPTDEPGGVFKYNVTLTKSTSNDSNVYVQDLHDIVRSSTDGTVIADFDLTLSSDSVSGNLTMLGSHDDHTCDDVLGGFPVELTSLSPTLSCNIVMQVVDDDLPSDSDELYEDFVRALVWDERDDPVGDVSCDPTAVPPITVDRGTCTNVVTVRIQDVLPAITIDKFAIAGPGYSCEAGTVGGDGKCSGSVYIDEPGGDVTYKLVITNTSTVDPLTITDLTDLAETFEIDLLGGGVVTDCDDNLPIELAVSGEANDDFTCTFVRDVSGALRTVLDTATVVAVEKTGHSEGNSATHNDNESVTIADVAPTVVLLKEVKVAGALDSTFGSTAEVDEPEGDVVYRLTVTNTSPSGEDISLLSLTDAVLAGPRVTQTAGGTCVFNGTVTIVQGTPYACTINATVTGEPGNELDEKLVNTAYVTITDGESNLDSNDSTATVTFANVLANIDSSVNISATVFVTITNGSDFESVWLTKLHFDGKVIDPLSFATSDHLNLINDGGYFDGSAFFPACGQPQDIVADRIEITKTGEAGNSYRCAFTVELLTDDDSADNVLSNPGAALSIEVRDDDTNGVISAPSVDVTVQQMPTP